jgi:hypothetical protein
MGHLTEKICIGEREFYASLGGHAEPANSYLGHVSTRGFVPLQTGIASDGTGREFAGVEPLAADMAWPGFWLRGGPSEMPNRGTRISRPNHRSPNQLDALWASAKVERPAVDSGAADDDPAGSGVFDGVLVEGVYPERPVAYGVGGFPVESHLLGGEMTACSFF